MQQNCCIFHNMAVQYDPKVAEYKSNTNIDDTKFVESLSKGINKKSKQMQERHVSKNRFRNKITEGNDDNTGNSIMEEQSIL